MLLYADDTILLSSHKNPEIVAQELSSALAQCYHWFTNNKLVMHSGKTESILITSKRKQHLQNQFVIRHGDQLIRPSGSVKYLGLKINNTLSGEEVVDSVLSKCNSRLKFMYRFKDVLDQKTKKLLTSALIQCHFDYASTAWYFSLTKHLKSKLQVAQNKVVRYILNLHPRTHIGQNELDRVGILSVPDRTRQLMLNHVYNVYNGTAPSYLCCQFTPLTRLYNTRHSKANFTTKLAHGIANNNFSINGCREWNILPENIKKCQSKDNFKKMIKQYLKCQAHSRERNIFIYS
jgi:hypothetical protein